MDIANLSLALNSAAAGKARQAPDSNAEQTKAEKEKALRKTAQEFEAVFISEMLSHAGFDKAVSQDAGFGGEAFSGMLVESYAEDLAEKGGFGLADQIYRQLKGQLK
ncbi:rod-binding protein [Hyphococcus luteus]|uniref:Chemotaxis protein chel n=1 Tax=Hyphococcus luteus TaxID=2058213 RepID=A0A2S7K4I4_9PROT|nr:rod-binding protein [Marinicaulis flavus]PQA87413.1 chemotaxis protein chel [Marinicaulis flavus]